MFGVKAFVEISGERFIASLFDSKAKSAIIAVKADKIRPAFTWRRKYPLISLLVELGKKSP
jgi:hypothetical protein